MSLTEITIHSLCVYGVTLLLTQGHAFGWWRFLVRHTIGRLTPDYPVDTCRMCQGVWVAAGSWYLSQLNDFHPMTAAEALTIYAFSYFLATQERMS